MKLIYAPLNLLGRLFLITIFLMLCPQIRNVRALLVRNGDREEI